MTENNIKRKPACPYSDSDENLKIRENEVLEAGQRVYNTTTGMTIIGDGISTIGELVPFKEGQSNTSVLVVDDKISDISENPVQNKVVKKYVDEKYNNIVTNVVVPTIDITEIENGHNVSITDINGTQTFEVKDGET
jgi:hypothetical protein